MRVFVAIILLQFCWCLPVEKVAGPPPKSALDFMKQYGYLKADKESSAALYTEEGLSGAIKTVQRFGALNETGRLDNATLKENVQQGRSDYLVGTTTKGNSIVSRQFKIVMNSCSAIVFKRPDRRKTGGSFIWLMASPRCGNADVVPGRRTKRFTFGSSGWNKRHITYYLANWSSKLGEEKVARLIGKALGTWGAYGSLKFSRQSTPDADIIVSFARGPHNDPFPFDGPGYVLAHAYFPNSGSAISGDIHFDDDEEWVESTPQELLESGTDFYSVALHELGHSLGLGHSNDQRSIMFPYYRGDDASSLQLGQDDILAMYQLYIARPIQETTQSTTESTTRRTRPYNTRPPREPPRTRTPELPTRTTQREYSTRIYTKNTHTQTSKTTEPTIYTRMPTYSTTDTERVRTSFPSTYDPFTWSRSTYIPTRESTRSTFTTSMPSSNYPTGSTWYTNSPPVRRDHTYREKTTTNNRFPYSTTEFTTGRDRNRLDTSGTTNRRTSYPPSIGTPTLAPQPNICQGNFDSVANLRGEIFVFKSEYIWRLQDRNRIVPGYPILLKQMFPHLPENIKKVEAAYQRPDGNMVLFTGDQYWVYDGSSFIENSPRLIHDYGIPLGIGGIDAVQTWGRNGKTYLYKNDRFWRYNETSKTVDPGYPAHVEIWRDIPRNMDAAMTWKDGITYFFKDDLYWAFDNNRVEATGVSPRSSTREWLGCP